MRRGRRLRLEGPPRQEIWCGDLRFRYVRVQTRACSREETPMLRRSGDIPWDSDASGVATGAAPIGVAERPAGAHPRRGARRNGHGLHPLPAELLPAIRLHGVRLHAISEKKTID